MNKDQLKGSTKEAAGKLQKQAGKAVGSSEQEVKGKARELAGKAQKAFGDAKQSVEKNRDH
jgi:uncharacterized protein YjbJ (UPF0337 family)